MTLARVQGQTSPATVRCSGRTYKKPLNGSRRRADVDGGNGLGDSKLPLARRGRPAGHRALFIPPGADYLVLQHGTVDVSTTGAPLAVGGRYYEIAGYMAGPIIVFGYTTNVINRDLWKSIPADLRQIIIEEGARADLEAMRIASYRNILAA